MTPAKKAVTIVDLKYHETRLEDYDMRDHGYWCSLVFGLCVPPRLCGDSCALTYTQHPRNAHTVQRRATERSSQDASQHSGNQIMIGTIVMAM